MKKYLFHFFIIIYSTSAMANLYIEFKDKSVKQGSVVDATITLGADAASNISQIKNSKISDTFYIYSISVPIKLAGEEDPKSEAKIVLLKLPQDGQLTHKLGNTVHIIKWSNVDFIPTEASEKLIFSNFEIPLKFKFGIWILSILGFGVLFGISFKLYKRYIIRKKIKKEKLDLKNKLLSGTSYMDVVSIWKNKSVYLRAFPSIEPSFKELEIILYKYQFKSDQTEMEKTIVLESYKEFLEKVKAGLNGI